MLLKELYDKPKNVNASTLRTVASSVDFIFELFQKAPRANLLDRKPVEILVVDDEILSRRAVSYALEKAGLITTRHSHISIIDRKGLEISSNGTYVRSE